MASGKMGKSPPCLSQKQSEKGGNTRFVRTGCPGIRACHSPDTIRESEFDMARIRSSPPDEGTSPARTNQSLARQGGEDHPVETGSRWTFLTNHTHVLILLAANPDMVLREVASRIGITERAVQRIIHELETGGYLLREKVGRKNHYRIKKELPLRHPIESHRTIGDLLGMINSKGKPTD